MTIRWPRTRQILQILPPHEKLNLLFFWFVSKMRSNIITFLTTHLMRIKNTSNMWHLCIYLWLEFKCINNFDPTFDARQIEIKQLWLRLSRASKVGQICDILTNIFDSNQIWLHLWRAWIKCGLCHLWFQSKVIKGGLWQSLTTHLMCAKAFFRAEWVQHYAVDSLLSQRIKYNGLLAQTVANFWSCSKNLH